LTKKNLTVVPCPPYFSLFPQFKIKLKGHHFDTIEVIEAESQAVLNTLTEHDFQDAFKSDRSAGDCTYAQKGTTSRAMVFSMLKVNLFLCVKTCAMICRRVLSSASLYLIGSRSFVAFGNETN
jgi:hypothetical protein